MDSDPKIYMKRCCEPAVSAGKKGHDTFGAVLAYNGQILEEAENTADYATRVFGHAEFNLVHQCANQYPDDRIQMTIKESVLEDEGMRVFAWWGGGYRPLEELIAEMDEVKRNRRK